MFNVFVGDNWLRIFNTKFSNSLECKNVAFLPILDEFYDIQHQVLAYNDIIKLCVVIYCVLLYFLQQKQNKKSKYNINAPTVFILYFNQ